MPNVLIVEDDFVFPVLVEWLQTRKVNVIQVQNAADAITELSEGEIAYDAVVLDLNLPFGNMQVPQGVSNMDAGWHVMHETRTKGGSPNQDVSFVVVSAWASTPSKAYPELREDPKCEVFEKGGGDPDEILEAILECVGN